jgi:hypothetical protein
MKPVNIEAFDFQGAQSDAILNKTSHPNGNISVFDNAALASLHVMLTTEMSFSFQKEKCTYVSATLSISFS